VQIHNVGRTDRFPSREALLGPDGALQGLETRGIEQHGRLCPDHYQNAVRCALGIPGRSVAIRDMRRPSDLKTALAAVGAYQPFTSRELRELHASGRQMAQQWGPLRGPVA